MKIIYTIKAAELRINSDGQQESGDTIYSETRTTEKSAKKLADKFLKDKKVFSVWIEKINKEDDGDPLYQWSKYKGDKEYQGGNYW